MRTVSMPRAEELLAQSLAALGLLVWLPLRLAASGLAPLFPKYVFAASPRDEHPHACLHQLRTARYSAGPLALSPSSPISTVRARHLADLEARILAGEFDTSLASRPLQQRPALRSRVRVTLSDPILPTLEGWLMDIRGGRGEVRIGRTRVLVSLDQLSAA